MQNSCDCCGKTAWWHKWTHRSKDICCDPCATACGPRPCFWLRAEYLYWSVEDAALPPLVTVNPTGALPVIGIPGTVVAYGGTGNDFSYQSGGRFTLGFGLPCTCNQLGIEATYFFLAERTTSATFSSLGVPSIGRPFINQNPFFGGENGFFGTGFADAELVALLGAVTGSVNVSTSTELWAPK